MNKMLALIAISAISLPATAAEPNAFYGSLGGGVYRLKSDGFKDSAPSAMVLGGYKLHENVAIEAAYTRLLDATDTIELTHVKVDGNVWDLSTKLSYPIGNRFSPYGRLGWSYTDIRGVFTQNSIEGTITERVNNYDDAFSWALGTGIKLNERLVLNAELGRVLINDADFDRLSLNLNYGFGSH